MPQSRMMALVGFMPNVSGRRSATPDVEPMPGSAPTSVPSSAPAKAKSRLAGVSAIPKPEVSVQGSPRRQGSGMLSHRTKISQTSAGVSRVAAAIPVRLRGMSHHAAAAVSTAVDATKPMNGTRTAATAVDNVSAIATDRPRARTSIDAPGSVDGVTVARDHTGRLPRTPPARRRATMAGSQARVSDRSSTAGRKPGR